MTWEANSTTPHVDVLLANWHESLLYDVDWRAHDSSIFLFMVNIDYDAKPNEFFIQG